MVATDSHSDDAFAALFAAERGAVLRFAYALVGDPEVAQDLAADAFARTYEHWRHGRVRDVGPYVRQAVANRARDHFRRVERRRREEHRARGDHRGQAALAEQVASTDEVRRLLQELPVRQRAAVVLRYWADYTDVAIADALGVPLGTAKSLLRRATMKLQSAVAEAGEDSKEGVVAPESTRRPARREQGGTR